MKVLDFIYNETTISFEPTGKDDVMVNATEMAKVFCREVKDFNKLESTNTFIEACLLMSEKNRNSAVLNDGISEESSLIEAKKNPLLGYFNFEKREDLINSKQNSGTWMHRILALKFAAWLDPFFDVWIIAIIDQIILGHYREVKAATFEKLEAERQYEEEKTQLMAKYPELGNLLVKQGLITEAEKKRAKALKAATDQLKFEFGNSQK